MVTILPTGSSHPRGIFKCSNGKLLILLAHTTGSASLRQGPMLTNSSLALLSRIASRLTRSFALPRPFSSYLRFSILGPTSHRTRCSFTSRCYCCSGLPSRLSPLLVNTPGSWSTGHISCIGLSRAPTRHTFDMDDVYCELKLNLKSTRTIPA